MSAFPLHRDVSLFSVMLGTIVPSRLVFMEGFWRTNVSCIGLLRQLKLCPAEKGKPVVRRGRKAVDLIAERLPGYQFVATLLKTDAFHTFVGCPPWASPIKLKWSGRMFSLTRYRIGVLIGLFALFAFPLASSFASPTGFNVGSEFEQYYEQAGGLPVFGYAVSQTQFENDRLVQYFERQRLELHPEHAGTPYEVLLGHLGLLDAERRGLLGHEAFQRQSSVPGTADYFDETGHAIADIFGEYWHSNGLDFGDDGTSFRESLALFGYPISSEFIDPESGLLTQYFERARFEYHPEHADTEYAVLLGHLGINEIEFQRAAGPGQSGQKTSGPESGSAQPVPVDSEGMSIPPDSLNAKDVGATGDGSTDDTDAIKRALERAKAEGKSSVYLPSGTYMIRAGSYWYPYDMEIVVPDGISLIGESRNGTILKVIPESVRPESDYWRAIEVRSNTQVRNLTLDGSKDQIDRSGFSLLQFQGIAFAWEGMTNVLIEDVRVHDIIGMGHESFGILANGGHDSVYRRVETFNVEGTGIQVEGSPFGGESTGLRLEDSVSYDNTWHGVTVMGNDGAVVSNVHVYDNDDMGVSVEWNIGEIILEDVLAHGNGFGGVGSFGENETITIVRPNLYQNTAQAPWFPGEIAIVVADHWAEVDGRINRGVTQQVNVRDCVAVNPRAGHSEIYYRYDQPEPGPTTVFNLDCAGSENWSVHKEASQ
jgi:hypothetical protein